MTRDEFEDWVNDNLSEAVEEMRDVDRSKKKWILALYEAYMELAKRQETEEEEPAGDPDADDDKLDLVDDEEDAEA